MNYTEVKIGKIADVWVGMCGYQEAEFGVGFTLSGSGWGTGDNWSYWATRPSGAKWSIEDQTTALGKVMLRLRDLMKDAKVESVERLKNKPIEVTFENNRLKTWRILTEVL